MDPDTNQSARGGVPLEPPAQPPVRPFAAPSELPPAAPDAEWQWARPDPVPAWQQGLGTQGLGVSAQPTPGSRPLPPVPTDDSAADRLPDVIPSSASELPAYDGPAQQPYSEPLTQAAAPTATRPAGARSRPLRFLAIIITSILLAAALAAGAYYLSRGAWGIGHKGNTPAPAGRQASGKQETASSVTDLRTLRSAVLGLPENLAMFQGDTGTENGYHVYATQGSTDAAACSLEFGAQSVEKLPGNTAEDVIARHMQTLRDGGATADAPAAGKPLTLPDAVRGTRATYRLPTWTYSTTNGDTQRVVHVSVAVMGDGSRQTILRQCQRIGGPVDAAQLAAVDKAAAQIPVTKR